MKHIILDLETLSTENTALIVSIGAVVIEPNRELITTQFYTPIDLESSMQYPFKIDASTLKWWFQQCDDAIKSTFVEQKHLYTITESLIKFTNLCVDLNDDFCVWGNSDSFDNVILENAYKIIGLECPFKYNQFRDFRTMRKLFNDMTLGFKEEMNYIREGTLHCALDDAIWEAKCLMLIIKHLKKMNINVLEF